MSSHPCLTAADVFRDVAIVAFLMAAGLLFYERIHRRWHEQHDAAYHTVPPGEIVL